MVANDVVNTMQATPVPIFKYTPGPATPPAISAIRADLVVDVNPGQEPGGRDASAPASSFATRTASRSRPARTPIYAGTGQPGRSERVRVRGPRGLQHQGVPLVPGRQHATPDARREGRGRHLERDPWDAFVRARGASTRARLKSDKANCGSVVVPMTRILRGERGSAIVLAIALMTMMIAVGLAAFSFVDTQQVMSMQERQRESSFNLAEAVLNSQSFTLSRRWAGAPTSYATTAPTCTNATAPAIQCPDTAQLSAGVQLARLRGRARPGRRPSTTTPTAMTPTPTAIPSTTPPRSRSPRTRTGTPTATCACGSRRRRRSRQRQRVLVALVQVTENVEYMPKQ